MDFAWSAYCSVGPRTERKNHRTEQVRPCIIDLNEVTFIDKSGQRLLCVLVSEGADVSRAAFTSSTYLSN